MAEHAAISTLNTLLFVPLLPSLWFFALLAFLVTSRRIPPLLAIPAKLSFLFSRHSPSLLVPRCMSLDARSFTALYDPSCHLFMPVFWTRTEAENRLAL